MEEGIIQDGTVASDLTKVPLDKCKHLKLGVILGMARVYISFSLS